MLNGMARAVYLNSLLKPIFIFMFIRFFTTLLLLAVATNITCQVIPQPGAKLNYTQVMFEYEKVSGSGYYLIQITEDTSGASFERNVLEKSDSATATLITNLQFGKKYQWRYAGVKNGQRLAWKGPYHFEILTDTLLYKNLVNLVITKNDSDANAGGLILNDCTHSITDRNGNLVWFLQKVDWHLTFAKKNMEVKPQIFDLRLTPYGTITYLADSAPQECDLSGKKLWKAPNDNKVSGRGGEGYNHDFKRLPNGHYMVLGNETWRKLPPYNDTGVIRRKYSTRRVFDGAEFASVEFATVMEYDKKGKLVWSWNSQNYLDPDPLQPWRTNAQSDWDELAHVNAFSTDKNNEYVYVGFRNISRIVKVEKSTGKVVDSWGQQWPGGEARNKLPIHRQHDANYLDDSTLAVFNSNDYPGYDSFSRAIVFSTRHEDNGRIVWSFDCDFDSLDRHASRNGGNIDRLKNGNFLICMGNMNRIFEVTPGKKIVWAETIKTTGKIGDIYFHRLYRAHYVSSLYPCYFAFQTMEDTVQSGRPQVHIKIFNKGSESDSYHIKVSAVSGKYTQQFNTASFNPSNSATYEIQPDKPLARGDKIIVTVSSITNPDFVRSNKLEVNK